MTLLLLLFSSHRIITRFVHLLFLTFFFWPILIDDIYYPGHVREPFRKLKLYPWDEDIK